MCLRIRAAGHLVPLGLGHQAALHNVPRRDRLVMVGRLGGRRHHIGFQPARSGSTSYQSERVMQQ